MCEPLGSIKCVGIQSWLSKGGCLSSSGSISQAEGCSSASRLHQRLGNSSNSQASAAEQPEGGQGSAGPGSDGDFERTKATYFCCCVSFLAKVGIKCSELSVTLAVLPGEHFWWWGQSSSECLAAPGTVTPSPAPLRLITALRP